MKLSVYGREVEILRLENEWVAYYSGNEGKKRVANDINIPSTVSEPEVPEYVSDLCHEWARPNYNEVKVL